MPKFAIVTRDEDGDWFFDHIVPASTDPDSGEIIPAWPSFTNDKARIQLFDTEENAVNMLGVVKTLGRLAWVREILPTTLKEAKAYAREFGCSLTKRDGEYRVCPLGAPEAQAYYTDMLSDALLTAKAMREAENKKGSPAFVLTIPHGKDGKLWLQDIREDGSSSDSVWTTREENAWVFVDRAYAERVLSDPTMPKTVTPKIEETYQ